MMLFQARQDVLAKQSDSELILYDSANEVIHILNMTAATIFQWCDGSHTPEEIAQTLEASFDGVAPVQTYADVKRTLDVLYAKHLVVRTHPVDRLRR